MVEDMYRLRKQGVFVFVNEKDKRIWVGSGIDCLAAIRSKLSTIDSVIKDTERVVMLPVLMIEDIKRRGIGAINKIYVFEWDEDIVNTPRHVIKRKNTDVKMYVIHELLKAYDNYAMETNRPSKELKAKCIEEGKEFAMRYMHVYKTEDIEYKVMKVFDDLKEITIEDIEKEINQVQEKQLKSNFRIIPEEVKEVKEVKEDVQIYVDNNNIIPLLEIESILRGTSLEELIIELVSDKAKEMYRYMNNIK